MAAAKAAGSSTHGKCATRGWTITVASLNSGAAFCITAGVAIGSSSPAYSRTGVVNSFSAALADGTSKAAPAKKPLRAARWRSVTPTVACA